MPVYPGAGIMGHMIIWFNFLRNCQTIFYSCLHHLAFPPATWEGSNFSTSSPLESSCIDFISLLKKHSDGIPRKVCVDSHISWVPIMCQNKVIVWDLNINKRQCILQFSFSCKKRASLSKKVIHITRKLKGGNSLLPGIIPFSPCPSVLFSSVVALLWGGFSPGGGKDGHRELSNSVRSRVPSSLVLT